MIHYIIVGVIVIIVIIFIVKRNPSKNVNKDKIEHCKVNEKCIIKKSNKVKKTPLYYVRYKGTVKLGIDFSDIDIKIDNENKIISIEIPDALLLECNVNAGEMDVIYVDNSEKKNEEKNFIKNGIEICSRDMEEKVLNDTVMLDIAKNNTKQAIDALITPLIKQMDNDYQVLIIDKEGDGDEEN